MKLAILGARGIPAEYGGFETFAEQLSVGLSQLGVDVTVYCERPKKGKPVLREYQGVRLKNIPRYSIGPISTILFDLACLWDARKSFDVVYMLGYGAGVFLFIPRFWGTEVWVNVDGLEWKRTKWNWLAKVWLRFMEYLSTKTSNRIVADAVAIADYLKARYRRLPPLSCIAYGAHLHNEIPEKPGEYGIDLVPHRYHLVVCRFEPENHVIEIVRGFLASGSKLPLVLVGHDQGSTYADAVREEAADDAHGRIQFLGSIYERNKLSSLRYHCCSYIHGHSVGGTNPSLLEAMACGTPILAHDNVFNREVAGENAYYFQTLADIGRLLLLSEQLKAEARADLRLAFQDRIRQHYSWMHVTEQYLLLLREQTNEWPVDKGHRHMNARDRPEQKLSDK